ncbi:MAG: hypothetical protein KGJ13_00635 [Patescibacteria group bacterium]|nr:hypothetical protein [Patescibacteria group bacterium]
MNDKIIKVPDTSSLTQKYLNKWAALSQDYKKVIASGNTLSEVLRKTTNEKRKVVFRVLPKLGFAPGAVFLD